MAAPPPIDPAARRVYELLTTPLGSSGTDVGEFFPGRDGTDMVCHLNTRTHPEQNEDGEEVFVIELFFSRSGTTLLQMAEERRLRYSRTSSSRQLVMAMFFELPGDPEKGEPTDFFDTNVFEIVVRPDPWIKNVATLDRHIYFLPHITSRVPPLVGLDPDAFRKKLYEVVEAGPSSVGSIAEFALDAVAFGLRFAGLKIAGIAGWMNRNSRMPEGLWNPSERPPELTELRDELLKAARGARSQMWDFDLGVGRVADLAESLPLVGDMVARINRAWGQAEAFMDGMVTGLEDLLGSAEDTVDTVVAYVCGLWDGIIEAVIGMLEFAGLLLRGLAALLREAKDLDRLTNVLRETTDEILQALAAVDWLEFGQRFISEIAPLIVDVVVEKAEVFIDKATRTSAVAAYYFGYLVYMVAEFFFPPLKFGQIAKAARAARVAATARFLAKVTG